MEGGLSYEIQNTMTRRWEMESFAPCISATGSPRHNDASYRFSRRYPLSKVRAMKLYQTASASTLLVQIAPRETGLGSESQRMEHCHDYMAINPKGDVAMLVLDNGNGVSENTPDLKLMERAEPQLSTGDQPGQICRIEMLFRLPTELYIAFEPLCPDASPVEQAAPIGMVAPLLEYVTDYVREFHRSGAQFTVADACLFSMLREVRVFGMPIPREVSGIHDRVAERKTMHRALGKEGLAA